MKNEDLATVLVSLMSVVEVLDSNLREIREQEATNAAVSRNTHQGNAILPTVAQLFCDELLQLRRDIDIKIAAGKGSDASNSILKGLTLPPGMVGRLFDPSRVLTDLDHQKCPWCGIFSLNVCWEDDGLVGRNGTRGSMYERRSTVWTAYLQRLKEAENNDQGKPPYPKYPKDPTNQAVMKRAPHKPKDEKI